LYNLYFGAVLISAKLKANYTISNTGIIFFMTQHLLTTLSNSSATLLSPVGTHSGIDITIQNVHATAIVYIGGIGVTSSNYGYRISPSNAWSIELSGNDELYAITNTNGSQVAVLKTSLELGN
jgi:hypothetical protein